MFFSFVICLQVLISITFSQDNTCYIQDNCGTECINVFEECINACSKDCDIIFEGTEINFFYRNSSNVGLIIKNKTNIHISGLINNMLSKPKIILHGLNSLFTFENCENITIDNLIFELYRDPFTAGIVNALNYVDKSFTMILNDLISYPFPGSLILNDGENYDWLYNIKNINGYDTINHKYITPNIKTENTVIKDIDVNTNEITVEVDDMTILNTLNHGQTIVLRHETEGFNLINFLNNVNILLSEVDIFNAAGNGFDFVKNIGIIIDNITFINHNKPMTITNKGINMELNQGDITILDSTFTGLGGNGISINNYFFGINATINASCVQLIQDMLNNTIEPWVNIGDIFEFRDRKTLKMYFKSKLIDFDAELNVATFLDELPLQKINPYDVITSITAEPRNVNIMHNIFEKSISIANNIKTSNVNFVNNIYDRITGPAILINCDAGNKLLSGVSKNIVINNNNITQCNYGDDALNGTITITATTININTNEDIPLTNNQVHNSIKISNNNIDETYDNGNNKAGLSIRAVRGFYINSNNIILPKLNYAAVQEFNDLLPTIIRSNKCKTINGQTEPCIVVKG